MTCVISKLDSAWLWPRTFLLDLRSSSRSWKIITLNLIKYAYTWKLKKIPPKVSTLQTCKYIQISYRKKPCNISTMAMPLGTKNLNLQPTYRNTTLKQLTSHLLLGPRPAVPTGRDKTNITPLPEKSANFCPHAVANRTDMRSWKNVLVGLSKCTFAINNLAQASQNSLYSLSKAKGVG